ncbi:HSP70 [Ectocarpus sp. CCAP 1310/34]|nr:HSP70 [Ectocarpus sp. CCAP 1310/34]
MSVIGIDFGNDTCVIGMAARGGIDIILNENSNRRNPTLVSFQGKQRLMGEGAASIARSNFKNTAREVKRLVGRVWGTPDLEADLARLPFKCIQHPETGGVGIEVNYEDSIKVFTPEQIIACMLTKLIAIAKAANNGIDVADTVMAIPGWYTDAMRNAMMNACLIGGVNCLRLIHEHTATALAYGIYKSAKGEFSEKEPQFVLFLDVGHSSFSASVVTFVQGSLTVKSAAFDSNLGGRDMDWAIAQHAADEFKAKTGKDPRTNPKALLKLLEAGEKAKKQLSPMGVTDAPINIECLWEDLDYNGRLSLEQFEALIKPIVDRMDAPILKALADAGVTKEQLGSVEIVGGSTRVPLVKSHLAELLGRDKTAINFGLSCTLNADESIARGCALQCAMLSKRFKVKDFLVKEIVPYPIKLSWEGEAPADAGAVDAMTTGEEAEDDGASAEAAAGKNSVNIFAKGDDTPKVRRVNLVRDKPFTVTASYDTEAEKLPSGCSSEIGTFKVDLPEGAGMSKIRVNVKHDIHGMFQVQSADMMQEVVKAPEPAPAKESEKHTDAAAPAAAPMDVDGGNATGEKAAAPDANGSASPTSPTENGEGPAAVAEAKVDEAPKKKVYTKVPLKIDAKTSAWSKSEIDRAVEIEAQMANQDRVLKETADKRNELESYVYAMRDKLVGSLRMYIEGEEADKFGSSLTAAEDWLYSDEGFDSTKSVYAAKLKELMDLGNPVESRFYEANNRQGAAAELQKVIDGYVKFANSSDEAYAHVEAEEKAKVRDCAKTAEKWLFQKLDQQANVPPSKDPIVTCDEINKQVVAVHATCRSIMNTPKPAPKPAEPPAAAPAKEEAKPAGGEGDAATAAASGEKGGESAAEASSAKAEGEAPKSGNSMDADTTPQEAAPPADGVPPSKTTAATAEPETPTPMETDEVEQLE